VTEAGHVFQVRIEQYLDQFQIGEISEDDFFEQKRMYAEPFQGFQESEEDADTDECMVKQDDLILRDANRLVNRSDEFQDSLKSFEDSVYIIHGQSGTGKSTYAHAIRHNLASTEGIEFHFMDFTKYHSEIGLNSESVTLKKLTNQTEGTSKFLWRVFALLLEKSFNLLNIKPYESEVQYLQRLNELSSAYDILFCNNPEQRDFCVYHRLFNCLTLKSTSEVSLSIIDIINQELSQYNYTQIESAACMLQVAFGFLMRIQTARYFNSITSGIDAPRVVFVIDNIEKLVRFCSDSIVVDTHEMNRLYNCLVNEIHEYNHFFHKIKVEYNLHTNPFCFLVVARNSTLALLMGREAHNDFIRSNCCVEITGWYAANLILEKRFECFESTLDESTRVQIGPYWQAFSNILKDRSTSIWSLGKFVEKMYNYSVRRITRMLSKAITDVDSDDYIVQFNYLWETGRKNNRVRHMCRQFVFALMLNQVRDDYTYLYNPVHLRLARRVIMYLSSKLEIGASIDFVSMVNDILVGKHQKQIVTEDIEGLFKVLYFLNEKRWDENGWSAQINIEDGREHAYTLESFILKLNDVWNNRKKGECSISINASGRLFAHFLSSTEFFIRGNAQKQEPGSQDLKHRLPSTFLVFSDSDQNEIIKGLELATDRVISEVKISNKEIRSFMKSNTETKVTNMYSDLSAHFFCYKNSADNRITYSLRLIHNTLGYIENYIGYVNALKNAYPYKISDFDAVRKRVYLLLVKWLCKIVQIAFEEKDLYRDSEGIQCRIFQKKLQDHNDLLTRLIKQQNTASVIGDDEVIQEISSRVTRALNLN